MATRCHSLSLVVICCLSLYHFLSLVVPLCHLLSFVFTCCTTRCHLMCYSSVLLQTITFSGCTKIVFSWHNIFFKLLTLKLKRKYTQILLILFSKKSKDNLWKARDFYLAVYWTYLFIWKVLGWQTEKKAIIT